MLGVCSHDMKFIHVLPGWEGSAVDSKVLRDAISRKHPLKVPKGKHDAYVMLSFEHLGVFSSSSYNVALC